MYPPITWYSRLKDLRWWWWWRRGVSVFKVHWIKTKPFPLFKPQRDVYPLCSIASNLLRFNKPWPSKLQQLFSFPISTSPLCMRSFSRERSSPRAPVAPPYGRVFAWKSFIPSCRGKLFCCCSRSFGKRVFPTSRCLLPAPPAHLAFATRLEKKNHHKDCLYHCINPRIPL